MEEAPEGGSEDSKEKEKKKERKKEPERQGTGQNLGMSKFLARCQRAVILLWSSGINELFIEITHSDMQHYNLK